jgi:hypothetical protein
LDPTEMKGSERDRWNEQAVLVALQPWEVDVIDRGLACLAALASIQPDWEHVQGQEQPALAVVAKLNQVLEYQGYAGGIDGLRSFLAETGSEQEPDAAA